jgi:NAD-dependent deacetylase
MQETIQDKIKQAADGIKRSSYIAAFTGAGISVESGIPPFRGEGGIWNKYEERLFDIHYFRAHPKEAWDMLCDGFYETTLKAKPNDAHKVLANMEKEGALKAVITQNIDNLHKLAGSKVVYELHGNALQLSCLKCESAFSVYDEEGKIQSKCPKCGSFLKPNFVFFGERLPEYDFQASIEASQNCDLMIIIGSTGTVHPAASLPPYAKRHGAKIIEINPSPSTFTDAIADIFIPLKAAQAMREIEKAMR